MARFTRFALARILTLALLAFPRAVQAQEPQPQPAMTLDEGAPKNAIEICPIIAFWDIYSFQYSRALTPKDSLILGFAYMNIQYDFGRSHAPTAIIGYRRFLYKGLHLEYQLMPSYNWFYETREGKYYNSPELWNEFRFGYEFDFHLGKLPVFFTPQWLVGFGLYGGDKPQSFLDEAKKAPVFQMPIFFVGAKF